MNDADRHDQIEALAELKRLLDDEESDRNDIRDAGIRAVNRFHASIAAHAEWEAYSRRGSSDPGIRAEASKLGNAGVERHPEYRGRLRRRIGDAIAEAVITETPTGNGDTTARNPRAKEHELPRIVKRWQIHLRQNSPWNHVATATGTLTDAEMAGARRLADL